MATKESDKPLIDADRRRFLKLVGVGSVGLFIGHFFEKYWGTSAVISRTEFENFNLIETKKDLKLLTSTGEEIITFEKD